MTANGSPALRASVSRSGARVVVSLAGELDLATGDQLRSRLTTVIEGDPPPEQLVLDVEGLDFVDASGISVLLGAQRSLSARGGQILLRSPSRLVQRVVKVLELEHVLPVEP